MKKVVSLMNPGEVGYEESRFSERKDVVFVCLRERTKEAIMNATADANVFLYSGAKIGREIIDNMEKCQLIIRYGIGYDDIDYEWAAKKGIMVCNAPNYGVVDVAEHAVSLIMACAKRLVYMHDCVRDRFWDSSAMGSSARLSGKTIGFVGFGKIAKCVCTRTNALGMKPIVYDPYVKPDTLDEYGAEATNLDSLLQTADYVTLHLPLNKETFHILDKDAFKKMKKSAYLINTSRGGLVAEQALVEALLNGEIAGAGLDVFEEESANLDGRFLEMQNVVLTPHVAWNTTEAAAALHKEVTDNVLRFLDGVRPHNIINM